MPFDSSRRGFFRSFLAAVCGSVVVARASRAQAPSPAPPVAPPPGKLAAPKPIRAAAFGCTTLTYDACSRPGSQFCGSVTTYDREGRVLSQRDVRPGMATYEYR
jgi:hypothetical protein